MFIKKKGFLKLKNQGGHSSFVFPHPFMSFPRRRESIFFPKKEGLPRPFVVILIKY